MMLCDFKPCKAQQRLDLLNLNHLPLQFLAFLCIPSDLLPGLGHPARVHTYYLCTFTIIGRAKVKYTFYTFYSAD